MKKSVERKTRSLTTDSLVKSSGNKHSLFRRKSAANGMTNTEILSKDIFMKLTVFIEETSLRHYKESAVDLSLLRDNYAILKYLNTVFANLIDEIISKRTKLNSAEKTELDKFIYQNQKPHVVYLYCKKLMADKISPEPVEWLITLMRDYEAKIANSLICVATQIELNEEKSSVEGLFREDSFSSTCSVCCAKAKAPQYLRDFVDGVIAVIRAQPYWPIGYDIECGFPRLLEQARVNFSELISAIARYFANAKYNPVIGSILTLRYDLLLPYCDYDSMTASLAAQSFFWLRLYCPLFRMQKFTDEEQSMVVKITTLILKASSASSFRAHNEATNWEFLNTLISTHLSKNLKECFDKLTAQKSEIEVFDYKENKYIFWSSLLFSSSIEENLEALVSKY
ncbi:MAG: hypothetical protein M3R00_00485 [Pseudomonadota bacterium]|nr:hypothetical protein [Pseudomonadota bacterium]